MRLLNIESSPRESRSVSLALTDAFLDAYREIYPEIEVDTLNVWKERLPEFDAAGIGAKYKGVSREEMDDAEAAVWTSIQSLARRFQEADRIVMGVPMWNFAYPYKLKQLIDLACQRDFLFTFDGQSYGPLLKAEKAFAIFVRGQSEEARFATVASPGFDHQVAYLDFWLRFIGVKNVSTLKVEHTWDQQASNAVAAAKRAVTMAAKKF